MSMVTASRAAVNLNYKDVRSQKCLCKNNL
jgi:hypothetical protein